MDSRPRTAGGFMAEGPVKIACTRAVTELGRLSRRRGGSGFVRAIARTIFGGVVAAREKAKASSLVETAKIWAAQQDVRVASRPSCVPDAYLGDLQWGPKEDLVAVKPRLEAGHSLRLEPGPVPGSWVTNPVCGCEEERRTRVGLRTKGPVVEGLILSNPTACYGTCRRVEAAAVGRQLAPVPHPDLVLVAEFSDVVCRPFVAWAAEARSF